MNPIFSRLVRYAALPITRLHVPFVSSIAAHHLERRLVDRRVQCTVRGVRWDLDLNDLIDHRIFYLGTHERFTTRRILEAMPRDGVFFDIGANIGYFTLLVAHQLRGTGQVYAFEPMARAMDRLRGHVAANGFTNVTAEKAILTDADRGPMEVAFQTSWPQYDPIPEDRTPETVPTLTLDQYVEAHRVKRMDVLKVDVDGFEVKVFDGATHVLEALKPRVLLELGRENLRKAGDSLETLLALFDRAGYRFYSETTMRPFESIGALLRAVPFDATLNVVAEAR